MNANFEVKTYVTCEDDPMLLPERVQLFAKDHGWNQTPMTLEDALGNQEGNIVAYTQLYGEAVAFMNQQHLPPPDPEGEERLEWAQNADGTEWGLCSSQQSLGATNKQESDTPPIS